MDDWVEQIELDILEQNLLPKGQPVLLAISGGLDSMVMLHLLCDLAPRHSWNLHVAHFNHQLRGRNSDADECLVRKCSEKLELPISVGRGDVREFAAKNKLSLEMAARELRHSFLARAARKNKLERIALAHHADDQVELFFLRLQRGSGVLSGMPHQSPSPVDPRVLLVRPLLKQTREALERFAKLRNVPFREDASNTQKDIPRNRIRQEVIPVLKQQAPPIFRTILRSMEIVGAEADFLSAAVSKWREQKTPPFSELHIALQRRILHDQLREAEMPVDFDLVERLRKQPGSTFSVGPEHVVSRTVEGKICRELREPSELFRDDSVVLEVGRGGACTFAGINFTWQLVRKTSRPVARVLGVEWFDADRVGGAVVLRHWRPGDRFQPIGLSHEVKLQDWFVNTKVTVAERRRKVVAVAGTGEIFWVQGMRISERFKIGPNTKRQIKWCWK